MRRIVVAGFLLLVSNSTPVMGQTCRGLAPLSATPIQVTGTGAVTNGSTSVAAGFAADVPMLVFGGVEVGTTAMEAFGKSTLDLGASLGYQLDLETSGRFQLCPIASIGFQVGPNNTFDSDVDRSAVSTRLGITAGASIAVRSEVELVPAIGLAWASRTDKAQNSSGVNLFRISNSYAIAQLHLGIILRRNLSLRPSVEVPIGIEGSDPAIGLTLGYNFGRRDIGRVRP
jgi:hypothetical protein